MDKKEYEMRFDELLKRQKFINVEEEMDEIDFIKPKKIVGKLISIDVLDKIIAEIDRQEKWLLQAGYTAYNVDIAFDAIKSVVAESEGKK